MTIIDGDTFSVMVAVLDTQFWLTTHHVICISIDYAGTVLAGLLGVGLHAYAGTADQATSVIFWIAVAHIGLACFALLPLGFWEQEPKSKPPTAQRVG